MFKCVIQIFFYQSVLRYRGINFARFWVSGCTKDRQIMKSFDSGLFVKCLPCLGTRDARDILFYRVNKRINHTFTSEQVFKFICAALSPTYIPFPIIRRKTEIKGYMPLPSVADQLTLYRRQIDRASFMWPLQYPATQPCRSPKTTPTSISDCPRRARSDPDERAE